MFYRSKKKSSHDAVKPKGGVKETDENKPSKNTAKLSVQEKKILKSKIPLPKAKPHLLNK